MKKVIHFKIPTKENGIRDNLTISAELTGKFLTLIKGWLGEEFCVIASPFEPSELRIDGNNLTVYNFDMIQIDVDDLIEMAEKEKTNDCTVL